MNSRARFATRLGIYFLVALSIIGFIVSMQQYWTIGAIGEAMVSERVVEESFVMAAKARVSSADDGAKRAVDEENQQWRVVHQSISGLVEKAQQVAMLAAALWAAVFIASAVTLIAGKRPADS